MPYSGPPDLPPPFWGHEPVEHVDVERAAAAVDAGAALVDLGHPDDWFAGHLPNAILIEPELIDEELGDLVPDRPVVVAGRDPGLTEEIVGTLRARGYDAAALSGGVAAWHASGRPLHKADGRSI